jgi:hypothetical protein
MVVDKKIGKSIKPFPKIKQIIFCCKNEVAEVESNQDCFLFVPELTVG